MGLNKSKFSATQVKNCMRTFLVHLFSHVGLCVLVVGYAVAGGFMFETIEKTEELDKLAKTRQNWTFHFNKTKSESALTLWKITERLNVLHENNWTKEVQIELESFGNLIALIARENKLAIENDPQWTFPRALMYSVSIITTIGYGNTAPQTTNGKILTMFYAIVGVPLMLLWVSNIGNLMANTFKFAYSHGPCCSPSSNTKSSKEKNNSSKKSKKNNKTNKQSNPTVQTSSFSRKDSKKKNSQGQGQVQVQVQEPSATTVQYNLNERKVETRLLHQGEDENLTTMTLSHNKLRRKGSSNGSNTIQGLTAGAKQVLLECAEYNVSQSQGGIVDERSRRILEQLQGQVPPPPLQDCCLMSQGQGQGGSIVAYPGPLDENSPGDQMSEAESVIDLHAMAHVQGQGILSSVQAEILEDEEAVHAALECYPYPPCPYPFYDTTLAPPPSGGILRKPSMSSDRDHRSSVKKTVSLIESCPSVYGTPSRVPLLPREETCPDLVDIERFTILDSSSNEITVCEKRDESNERVPTSIVLSIVVIYILLGAFVFRQLEKWDFADAAYFCFITLSTIGLGDLTPGKSLETKDLGSPQTLWVSARLVFCCVYLVLGLAIIAMSFSLVQEDLTLRMKNMARKMGIIGHDEH